MSTMEGVEDGGGDEVVQVIMQDDGQIVMPEGQFIQLDTENSEMQYIQVLAFFVTISICVLKWANFLSACASIHHISKRRDFPVHFLSS